MTAHNEMTSLLLPLCESAKTAAAILADTSSEIKNRALLSVADALSSSEKKILSANLLDLESAVSNGISSAMLDRLRLDSKRITAIADAVRELAELDDPIGKTLETVIRPNGLIIEKVSVPIGVIGIIYEARPNVTVDAAMICLKAGNATLLRGGSESFHSNQALTACIHAGLCAAGLPETLVQLLPTRDRAAVNALVRMDGYVDLIIPRGGESLIRTVVENATVPVIKHYKGVCHLYVDTQADLEMALAIILNGKCQRPGVCNALEKVIIHRDIAVEFVPHLARLLRENRVEMRGDTEFCALIPDAIPATEADWSAEYLDLTLTLKIVTNTDEAIEHINRYSSHHSETIITANSDTANRFLRQIQSAVVYHNASTRFTDGGEFGMGAEIGISTDKLHARGPMGLRELTSYQYRIRGTGQIR